MHILMTIKKNRKHLFPKYFFLFHIFLVSSFKTLFSGSNSTSFLTCGINFLHHLRIRASEPKCSLSAADSSKNFASGYIYTLFLVQHAQYLISGLKAEAHKGHRVQVLVVLTENMLNGSCKHNTSGDKVLCPQ